MNRSSLIESGFKEHLSNGSVLQPWDVVFQKRIRDENGTRYFVDVYFWNLSKYGKGDSDSFSAEVTYGDGCAFHPQGRAFMQVGVHSINDWKPEDVIKWADELWIRLCPNYYERNQ